MSERWRAELAEAAARLVDDVYLPEVEAGHPPDEVLDRIADMAQEALADAVLAAIDADARFKAAVAAREAEGFRIVDGGQVGAWADDDTVLAEFIDYRTKEVLWSGRVSAAELEAGDEYWEDHWLHVDRVYAEAHQ